MFRNIYNQTVKYICLKYAGQRLSDLDKWVTPCFDGTVLGCCEGVLCGLDNTCHHTRMYLQQKEITT